MCRLLGLVSRSATTIERFLGDTRSTAWLEMTAVHSDGYGYAWKSSPDLETFSCRQHVVLSRGRLVLDRSAEPPPSVVQLAHMRLASPRMPVAAANTHPFIRPDFAFAHNGHLGAPTRLADALKSRGITFSTVPGTDSEIYADVLFTAITAARDPVSGVRRAVHLMSELAPTASLNAIVAIGNTMIGIQYSENSRPPYDALRRRTLGRMPSGHGKDYFAMFIDERADGSAAISSNGPHVDGWTRVPSNTLVVLDPTTRGALFQGLD